MAACGSLHHMFETHRSEKTKQTLLESLSQWNQQLKPTITTTADEAPSFTEIFGGLHFKETLISTHPEKYINQSYGSSCSESLQLCTEGLGFESSYDMDDWKSESGNDKWREGGGRGGAGGERGFCKESFRGEKKKNKKGGEDFPPPISSVGKIGRPWVCFKAYREEGRFVLEEIRIPKREFLEARREDGRLKMKLVHPHDDDDDETVSEEENEDRFDDDDDDDDHDEASSC